MSLHGVDVRKEQFTTGTLLCRCSPLHPTLPLRPTARSTRHSAACPTLRLTLSLSLPHLTVHFAHPAPLTLRHSLTLCLVELFVELSWLDKSHELANFVKSNNCTGKLQCDSNPSNPGRNYIIYEAPPFVCLVVHLCVYTKALCNICMRVYDQTYIIATTAVY